MKIFKITINNLKSIEKDSLEALKKGLVLICPTDTVYGLICDATNKEAVEKIFKIKKRLKNKPIPIFVRDIKMVKKLALANQEQEKFLRSIWPGKITVVLKRTRLRQGYGGQRKIKLYGVDKKTIALRIPNYRLLLNLVKHTNLPITGTSANISGKPASGNIKEVLRQFENQKHQPDLIINAGNLPKSKPSKIIDLTKTPYKILRY